MSIVIDTPEGIAFARAAARLGGLKLNKKGVQGIVKTVYGLRGNRASLIAQLQEYVDGTLAIREWDYEYGSGLAAIVNEVIDELPDGYTKDDVDAGVQRLYNAGAISEQEGNDACLMLFVQVVRDFAGRR